MNLLDKLSSTAEVPPSGHSPVASKPTQSDELSRKLFCTIESFKSTLLGEGLISESTKSALKRCLPSERQSELPKLDIVDQEKIDTPIDRNALQLSTQTLTKLVGAHEMQECLTRLAGVSQDKRDKFVLNVASILTDTRANADPATRNLLAKEIIDQVTHPEKIKQGHHGTCGLASVETNLALSRPDAYAASVLKWSRTIDYSSKIPTNELQNVLDDQSKIVVRQNPGDHRSLVSQIFQTGAANVALEPLKERYEAFSPTNAPNIKTSTGSFKPDNDSGERVLDSSGKVLTWQGVTPEDEIRILKKLTGDNYTQDKLQANSPQELIEKLRTQLAKDKSPDSISLNFVLGGHAVTILSADAGKNQNILFLDSADEHQKVQRMSAKQLFDAAIEGDQVVRIGDPESIDGMTYRKPYKLSTTGNHYLSIVHKTAVGD